MEPDVTRRARERAQELIAWIEAATGELDELRGTDAHARGAELVSWLQATLATAQREHAARDPGQPLPPSSLVKDVMFVVDLLAHDRPGEVEIEIAARATPWVRGDRWSVRRLLLDVLLDARAAEPMGGKLRLEIDVEADQAVLRIKNHGPELRKIELTKTPTPRSLERHAKLIKAARLLGSLGGGLSVEGELGCGMMVTIRLPLLASRALPATRSTTSAGGTACPKNEPASPCA